MSALRFPIRFWLVLTIWFAVAFIALRNGTEFWLGVIATLTALAMALALQRALRWLCVRRWFWTGFLVGSTGYLFISFGPRVDRWHEGFEKQQTLVAEERLRQNSIPIGNASGPAPLRASRFLKRLQDRLFADSGEGDGQSAAALFVDLLVAQRGAYQGIGHLVLSWMAGLVAAVCPALLGAGLRRARDVGPSMPKDDDRPRLTPAADVE